MTDAVRLGHDELAALLRLVFGRAGCPPEVARLLADNMTLAEGDGAVSHGLFRVEGLLASIRTGWLDPAAAYTIDDVAPGLLRADGGNGLSMPILEAARLALMEKARVNGIALLTIRHAHHFSAVWPDIEPFARDGFLALAFINSMASVVPQGGRRKVYGTNPMGLAVPRAGRDPLVFDQASSAMANGDVQIAAREGRSLPPGTGVDRDGNPTTDPRAVLDGGALLPFGGHKGSSIAMMMEIMGAALAGSAYSFEIDWSDYPGAATPPGGQTYILADPGRGAPAPFAERLEVLFAELADAGVERLPSDRRYANRRVSRRDGIAVAPDVLARLRELAG